MKYQKISDDELFFVMYECVHFLITLEKHLKRLEERVEDIDCEAHDSRGMSSRATVELLERRMVTLVTG